MDGQEAGDNGHHEQQHKQTHRPPQVGPRHGQHHPSAPLRRDRALRKGGLKAVECPWPRLDVKRLVEPLEDLSLVDQINASRT
jgi:hypothetical protein